MEVVREKRLPSEFIARKALHHMLGENSKLENTAVARNNEASENYPVIE